MDRSALTKPISTNVAIHANNQIHHVAATQEGGAGNDYFWGTSARDILYGNDGNDQFHLTGGNDKAYGGNGNDFFDVASGNHFISGGAGDDFSIVWGTGDYTMTGGAGADRYGIEDDFKGHITITDFHGAEGDHIDFAKPVVSLGLDASQGRWDYTFTDGSSLSLFGEPNYPDHYTTYHT